jgi:hypothetical protein
VGWIRKHRPSPATAIALAALVVALAGAAFAAIPDSSGTIHGCYNTKTGSLRVINTEATPAQTCKSRETALDWNQQGAPGSGAVVSDEQAGEVTTNSSQPIDLGGPTVTVNVPANTELVGVFARADIDPGSDGVCGKVYIHEPQGVEPALPIMQACSTTQTVWTSPDYLNPSSGTRDRQGGSWLLLEVPPGSRTFSLEYSAYCSTSDGCASTFAAFRNRRLWVEVLARLR